MEGQWIDTNTLSATVTQNFYFPGTGTRIDPPLPVNFDEFVNKFTRPAVAGCIAVVMTESPLEGDCQCLILRGYRFEIQSRVKLLDILGIG